jgi:hypothetical protein
MATTTHETHDALRSLIQKVSTMVADLQTINDEQQDCLYKLDVLAGIQLPAQPPPTPLPALASTNLVQSPLETMDALPTVTEPPLLPTPTAATGTSVPPPLPCTPSPQPVVWLEPPPTEAAGTIEVGDGKADDAAFNPDGIGNGSTDTQFFGSDHELLFPAQLGLSRPARLSSSSLSRCGSVPSFASFPTPLQVLRVQGVHVAPRQRVGGKAADIIAAVGSTPSLLSTTASSAASRQYKPTLFAWDPGGGWTYADGPQPRRSAAVHIPQP